MLWLLQWLRRDDMSKARRIIPTVEERGRCEAQRKYTYLLSYENKHPDKQCCSTASIEIEGKRYCFRHAGIVALQILLGEKNE